MNIPCKLYGLNYISDGDIRYKNFKIPCFDIECKGMRIYYGVLSLSLRGRVAIKRLLILSSLKKNTSKFALSSHKKTYCCKI